MNALLKIQNLTLHAGKKLLCEHLHLNIQAGEMWGILGPNGCGKTSLLQTLAGLLAPTRGKILLEGISLSSLSRKKIAQKLGILFQDTHDIFPQTVWDICQSGRYPHTSSAHDYAITERALFDMNLIEQAQQCAQTLSGGERKRLSIATLLTQSPIIYLLDEPTNHLDLHYQITVLNHFKNLTQRTSAAVLMSLHDINLAAHYCQKIILLLGNGEYLAGTSSDILTTSHLTHLYQHPMEKINVGTTARWMPCFETIISDSSSSKNIKLRIE